MTEEEHKSLSNIIDPFTEAVLISRTKEMVSRWASRADFVKAVFPDKQALKASDLADEIFGNICNGKLNIEGINSDLIKSRENSTKNKIPKLLNKQVDKEINKINKYVSKQTGVSLKRMKRAVDFWLENVLGS